MVKLDEEQIDQIVFWMNNWSQLKGTVIPIRFKEDFLKQSPTVIKRKEQVEEIIDLLRKIVQILYVERKDPVDTEMNLFDLQLQQMKAEVTSLRTMVDKYMQAKLLDKDVKQVEPKTDPGELGSSPHLGMVALFFMPYGGDGVIPYKQVPVGSMLRGITYQGTRPFAYALSLTGEANQMNKRQKDAFDKWKHEHLEGAVRWDNASTKFRRLGAGNNL